MVQLLSELIADRRSREIRQQWRFKHITIDNTWAQGAPEIHNALAGRHALRAKSKQSK